MKSGRVDLDDLAGAGNVIKTALSLMDHHEYGDAKLACLPTVPAIEIPGSFMMDYKNHDRETLDSHYLTLIQEDFH